MLGDELLVLGENADPVGGGVEERGVVRQEREFEQPIFDMHLQQSIR